MVVLHYMFCLFVCVFDMESDMYLARVGNETCPYLMLVGYRGVHRFSVVEYSEARRKDLMFLSLLID